MIISDKYGIYRFPQELQNDLRLSILGNQKKSKNSQNKIEL